MRFPPGSSGARVSLVSMRLNHSPLPPRPPAVRGGLIKLSFAIPASTSALQDLHSPSTPESHRNPACSSEAVRCGLVPTFGWGFGTFPASGSPFVRDPKERDFLGKKVRLIQNTRAPGVGWWDLEGHRISPLRWISRDDVGQERNL